MLQAVASETEREQSWPEPDMSVLQPGRARAPRLPITAFGPAWAEWIRNAAEAAACPPDYVAAPLLAMASALIGNARWAQATPGWVEPPHLWLGVVGESGTGKSPGADCLMRDVLPEIERRMRADFPDRLRGWRVQIELDRLAKERWRQELRKAGIRRAVAPSAPVLVTVRPEPQMPRLRQHDVTIEKVAELLSYAAPKGLLIVRDELAGWIAGMNNYHAGGRAFWIEAYGGRPYLVERKASPSPIIVPRLAVAVYGGTQPDRLVRLLREADDGLLARLLWVWPEPIPFRLGSKPRARTGRSRHSTGCARSICSPAIRRVRSLCPWRLRRAVHSSVSPKICKTGRRGPGRSSVRHWARHAVRRCGSRWFLNCCGGAVRKEPPHRRAALAPARSPPLQA